MHETNERQLAHPWLLARQRSQQLDLPPGAEAPSNPARMALEAAFEPRKPPTAPPSSASRDTDAQARSGGAMPAVVVKRKRAFAAPDAPGASVTEASPEHVDAEEDDRAPRVFRVGSASGPICEPTAAPTSPAFAVAAASDGVDVVIPPIPVTAARRPRRRAAPVIVTTIAAQLPESGPATAPGGHDQAGELLERLAALDATFASIQDARDFRVLDQPQPSKRRRDLRSHFALSAEIKRLQAVAEAAREAEASEAISWIKRAIDAYGLTRQDLGI